MKKLLVLLFMLALLVSPAQALIQHSISIENEFGEPVTNITSITIFNSGLGTSPTIFSDRGGTLTMTNPITTSSDNTTLVQSLGQVRWFQQKPTYKITLTDGTKTFTFDSRNESDTRIPWYVNYIGTAASLSVNDNQSITVGTDLDMVLSWVNASDLMNWIPASDGSAFNLGSTSVAKQVDFNVFVGGIGGGGFAINEGDATLVWTGGTASLNNAGTGITNIGNGSTGAVNIGSSTAGVITIDSTSTATLNADASVDITTSDGSGDVTLDATLGSIVIDCGEAAVDDGIVIATTGAGSGIQITSLADIDITTTGAAGEDITLTNTGGTIILNASEDVTDAIDINASAGGIDIDATGEAGQDIVVTNTGGSINLSASEAVSDAINIDATGAAGGIDLDTTNGPITLTAANASNGDITITAADDMTLAVTGSLELGKALQQRYITVYAGNASLVAAQSGGVIASTAGSGSQFFQLPTAVAGLIFTFVDRGQSAGDDVVLLPAAGDSIRGAAVAKYVTSTTDDLPSTITVVAVNNGSWEVTSEAGTWLDLAVP